MFSCKQMPTNKHQTIILTIKNKTLMKKQFVLWALLLFCTIPTFAYDFEVDGIYYDKLGGDSVGVDGSVRSEGDIIIPATVKYNSTTYRVTTIGDDAFQFCSDLIEITIPNSVTSIGDGAFDGCSNLIKITIPNSVTSIGDNAFSGCSNLSSVTIPESLIRIGSGAFSYCNNLTTVTWNAKKCADIEAFNPFFECSQLTSFYFGNNVEYIPASLCVDMSNLHSITFPNSVTAIGSAAFAGCSSLTSINFPENITSIGNLAFYGCFGLTSISIPQNVTFIGSGAFEECTGLTSVIWKAKNCADINYGDSPFNNCSQLTSFTFGDNVEHIPALLCYGCSHLTSITLPNSVKSIGNSAFAKCSGLVSITIPNSVTRIDNYAFYGCSSLTTPIYTNSMFIFMPTNYLGAYTIPNGIKSIVGSAFRDCSKLTSITFPEGLTSIDECAFYGCTDLTSISIPHGVNSISNYVFSHCSSLTSITIPNSVTSIGERAFSDCSNLKAISIPNSVDSIGYDAFYNCGSLTEVTIPNSVTTIGYGAFNNCANIGTIIVELGNPSYHSAGNCLIETATKTLIVGCKNSIIPTDGSVTTIGAGSFTSCSSLTSITISDGVTSIENYAFRDCSNLTSISIPNSVTSIGYSVFYGCSNLQYTITENVKYLGNIKNPHHVLMEVTDKSITLCTIHEQTKIIASRAFSGCSSLTEVTIPNSVTSIGNYAFFGCSDLTAITIPNSVTSIGNEAFSGCSSLTEVTIPNSVTSIGNYAFARCSSLTEIIIPNSVTSIGNYAFARCSSLTEIIIPNSVTSIGNYAFFGCSGLTEITCEALTPPTIGEDTFDKYTFNDNNLMIYVCYESEEAYKNAPYWSELNIQSIKEFESNGIYYQHTGDNSIAVIYNKGESYDSYDNRYSGAINIPATVEKNNVTYHVTTIDEDAFSHCYDLTAITIPNSVTHIGYHAFQKCNGLRQITIGSGIENIANYAFAGCTGLVTLSVGADFPPIVQANTFQNVSTTAIIKVPCGASELYKAASYWNVFTNYQDVMLFAFSATSADKTQGKVTISQKPTCDNGAEAIFEAKPAQGYEFMEWNDGDTDNPRTVEVIEDVEYIATFALVNDAVENVTVENISAVRKVFEDGTIYILRNGEKYTIDGRKIM